ncbi:MAG: diadenylate cyclase [Clostridia bacterium]|nr:diadenylate cyclase [Clostridia bacterium]
MKYWDNFLALIDSLSDPKRLVSSLIFVFAIAFIYYITFKFLKNNNSGNLITIFVLLIFFGAVVLLLADAIPNGYFIVLPTLYIFFILIVYSLEIKRSIWSRQVSNEKNEKVDYDQQKIDTCINEIIKALQNMSKNDIGALIVLSNGNVPNQILDSGVRLNCDISSQLIESVFFPKTPLHDGALIINGTKIVAAGCFLPLTQKENLPKELGSRHRAGIGITETIDVTSLIVSEETGIISTVKAGKITRYADTEMLKNALSKFYWQDLFAQGR